jgi:pyridoxine/pyridoxamine 5'-phosphate oxidase
MAIDVSECIKKSVEEVKAEIDRLQCVDDKLIDLHIKEYEAKILRMQLAVNDPKTDPEKREILIKKIENRTFAYYAMTESKKVE